MELARRGEDNFVPLPYRRVSFRRLDGELTPKRIERSLMGVDAYRRTEFIVLESGGEHAVIEVETEDREPLFSPITNIRMLATPSGCRFVEDAGVDVGLASALAAVAVETGVPHDGTLIVEGKYSHINFIHRPHPLTIRVFDVVPPDPPKLIDLVERVLAYEPLPAIRLETTVVDLRKRAAEVEAPAYLFPCRASGVEEMGVPVFFLDEHPDPRDWVLVGCRRTREIYDHFYGDGVRNVEMCPRELKGRYPEPLLIRCCQLEEGFQREGRVAQVPWGAEPEDVEKALRSLHNAVHQREATQRG